MSFKFDLLQEVKIKISDEKGHIKGRVEYSNMNNQYFVRYVNAGGRAVEDWIDEDELLPSEAPSQ